MPADYFLRTPRLGFRRWTEADLELAQGLWGDPRVAALIDARGALSAAQVAERLAEELTCQREHGVQYWPIFLLEGEVHVGCCGLRPRPEPGVLELGFHIRADHWREGYAGEAARATIDHAFATLGAASLFAGHHPDNQGSRRLLERLGFVHAHDELYPPTGLLHPSYALFASAEQR